MHTRKFIVDIRKDIGLLLQHLIGSGPPVANTTLKLVYFPLTHTVSKESVGIESREQDFSLHLVPYDRLCRLEFRLVS